MCRDLEAADVQGLRALLAFADLELDGLVLFEGLEAGTLNLRVVNEDVVASVGRGDEPETLLRVEPLNGALCHC